MRNSLFKHGDNLYLILKNISEYHFIDKEKKFNSSLLKSYVEFLGGNHVFQDNGRFIIVKAIEDAQIEDI